MRAGRHGREARPRTTRQAGRPGAAGLPGAQEAHRQARRTRSRARRQGLDDRVPRGPEGPLLTDKLFFDSGSAAINAAALPTLGQDRRIIATERDHPVQVEGHTDDRPIATSQYPSNWQLSGARAGAVVQRLARAGVSPKRLSLGGYAAEHPVAQNATPAGRAQNRRVEIVLTRLHGANSVARRRLMNKKMIIIVVVALVAARRRLQDRAGEAGRKAAPKPKVTGAVYVMPKEFLVNLADGRYAKLRSPWSSSTPPPAAGGHGAARRRRRATARSRRRPSCATSSRTTLTDASDKDLIDRARPREDQEEDPQGDQEAHGRPHRGRPLPRRDGPVTVSAMKPDAVDYVPFEATVGPGRPGRPPCPAPAAPRAAARRAGRARGGDRPHDDDDRRDAGPRAGLDHHAQPPGRRAGRPARQRQADRPRRGRGDRRGVRPAGHRGRRPTGGRGRSGGADADAS